MSRDLQQRWSRLSALPLPRLHSQELQNVEDVSCIRPLRNGKIIRLKETRDKDEAMLSKIFTITDQVLVSIIIGLIHQKTERGHDSFSLVGEASLSSLHHLDQPVNILELCEPNAKQLRLEHCDSVQLEAEKKVLKYLRFFRVSTALDSVSFSAESLRSVEKLLKWFNIIAGEELFSKRSFQTGQKGPFPAWFKPRWRFSVASWVVAQFELRVFEAFQSERQLRGCVAELPGKACERVLRSWLQISEAQRVAMISGVFETASALFEACVSADEENRRKRRVLTPEEKTFALLYHTNREAFASPSELRECLSVQLAARRREEGDKNFIAGLLYVEPRNCYSLLSFFGSLLTSAIVDFSTKQLINELSKDPKRKKNQSHQPAKKPARARKPAVPQRNDLPAKHFGAPEESEETNEEESVQRDIQPAFIPDPSPESSPHAPSEFKQAIKDAIPLIPTVSDTSESKKDRLAWNSDEEKPLPKRQLPREQVPSLKKPKLARKSLAPKPQISNPVEPPKPKKRDSAPVVLIKTWEEEEDLALCTSSISQQTEKQNETENEKNTQKEPTKEKGKNVLARCINRKPLKSFEAYVDKEGLLKDKINEHVNRLVEHEVQRISSELLRFSEETTHARQLVKERIEFIVKETSQGLFTICEYGSSATGLITPFSDLDLAIDGGSASLDRSSAIAFLKLLDENLEICEFVTERKQILSASVPVLKLEVDPSVEFQGRSGSGRRVRVDVIVKVKEFFDSEHTSTRTTAFVNSAVELYPTFLRNTLVLKFSLNCLQYMNAYKGGLNSYGLCLLYIAFLLSYRKETSSCHGASLLGFLDFVCNEFDPSIHAVSLNGLVRSGQPCLSPRSLHTTLAPLVIFDPTNFFLSNVTASCQSFTPLVDFLRGVLNTINTVKAEAFGQFWPEFDASSGATSVPPCLDERLSALLQARFTEGTRLLDFLLGLKPIDSCRPE